MTNGTKTTDTVTSTVTTTTYEYPGLDEGSIIHVHVSNGIMVVDALLDGMAWSAVLPVAAAPLMMAIAQDMMEELAAQTPPPTDPPTE